MALTRLTVGSELEGIPGRTWNAIVDHVEQSRATGTGYRDGLATSLRWKNANAGDAPAGALVRLTGIADISNVICLTGDKPDGTLRSIYGVNREIVATGKIGELTLFGANEVHYYTSDGTPAFGEWWGPEPSQWYLRKGRPGWMVLGNPAGSSSEARVKAFGQPIYSAIGKLSGSLSVGSSATVNIWGGAGGSEAVITGLAVTARDWFMKSGATALASGTKVKIDLINGVWYVTQAECQ